MTPPGDIAPAGNLETLSRRLVAARWVAAAVILPAMLLAWGPLQMTVDFWSMVNLVRVTLALVLTNLLVGMNASKRTGPGIVPEVRAIRLDMQVRLQLAVDVVALALVFHSAGGIESYVPFLGAFHVAAVSAWMGRAEGRKTAWAVLMAALLVVMLELNGFVHHIHVMNDFHWGLEEEPRYVLIYCSTLAAVLFLVNMVVAGARMGGAKGEPVTGDKGAGDGGQG